MAQAQSAATPAQAPPRPPAKSRQSPKTDILRQATHTRGIPALRPPPARSDAGHTSRQSSEPCPHLLHSQEAASPRQESEHSAKPPKPQAPSSSPATPCRTSQLPALPLA